MGCHALLQRFNLCFHSNNWLLCQTECALTGYLPKLRTFFHVDIWLFWRETFKIPHSGVMSSHHIAKQLPWDKVSPVEGKRIIAGCYALHVKKEKKNQHYM